MTSYTRPESAKALFIAYTAKPYQLGNDETGETEDVRPDVYVKEYNGIKVKKVNDPVVMDDGWSTQSVLLDARSVGLERDFPVNVQAGTPVAEALIWAYSSKEPLYIAIETRRRPKQHKGGELISAKTPIHKLRGANPNSNGGSTNPSEANCVSACVAAGLMSDTSRTVWSTELRSDPNEWPMLRRNNDGSKPPRGWRRIKTDDVEAGYWGGAIVGVARQSTSTVDAQELASLVREVVREEISQTSGQRAASPAERVARGPNTTPAAAPVPATEARQWEPYNSDGRVNAGSFLMAKERGTFRDAFNIVTNAWRVDTSTESTDDTGEQLPAEIDEYAEQLATCLLWLADQVQVSVTGRLDRMARSHFEAAQWVQWVIDHRLPYAWHLQQDQEARRQWALEIRLAATRRFQSAHDRVTAWLQGPESSAATADEGDESTAPQEDAEAAGADESSAAADAEPTAATPAAPQDVPGDAVMASDDPELIEEYEQLLASMNSAGQEHKFAPLLAQIFEVNQGHLTEIPAEKLRAKIREWATDHASRLAFWNSANETRRAKLNVGWKEEAPLDSAHA